MDPQTDLPDLVEDLEVNIDELASTLSPLLPPHTLSSSATSLPLLEKSKLHVLAAYAIESILFSTLQASGADAKSHAIFAELARLKTYFAKIKHAEEHFTRLAEKENRARLDVGAAQRFIKHGLSGNERYDEMRKERMAKEKERALEKARALTNKKFGEDEKTPKKKRGAEDVEDGEEGEGTPAKKVKVAEGAVQDEEVDEEVDTPATAPSKKKGRKAKQASGVADAVADADAVAEEQEDTGLSQSSASDEGLVPAPADTTSVDTATPAKKKRGRPSKKDKAAAEAATPQKTDTPTRATRSSAPKTRSEAFQALASGLPASEPPSASKAKGKGKGKSKGKK